MAGRYIDLHTHSTASDGTDTPAAVVGAAAKAGLAALALTDHDTVDGLDEAGEEADKAGLRFIRGIEIAVRDEAAEDELHIVGLWLRQPSAALRAYLAGLWEKRRERNMAMLQALALLGMPVAYDDIRAHAGGRAVGRPHIAKAMQEKGYVADVKEAFERYIGQGGAAFVARELDMPADGIGMLREEGATVLLAHPCLKTDMSRQRLDALLQEYKTYGLSGIEAYHSAHAPEQVRMCVELAAKHGLLLSGGSDYHGNNKPGIHLGVGKGKLRVPYLLLEKMIARRQQKGLWV